MKRFIYQRILKKGFISTSHSQEDDIYAKYKIVCEIQNKVIYIIIFLKFRKTIFDRWMTFLNNSYWILQTQIQTYRKLCHEIMMCFCCYFSYLSISFTLYGLAHFAISYIHLFVHSPTPVTRIYLFAIF